MISLWCLGTLSGAVSTSIEASLLLDLQTGSWEAHTFGHGFDAHLPLCISCLFSFRCSPPSLFYFIFVVLLLLCCFVALLPLCSFFLLSIALPLCCSSTYPLFTFRAVLLVLGFRTLGTKPVLHLLHVLWPIMMPFYRQVPGQFAETSTTAGANSNRSWPHFHQDRTGRSLS